MNFFNKNALMDPDADAAQLPVIDLGPYLRKERGSLNKIASELASACSNIGFFYIINHGVSEELVAAVFAESRRFHDLPVKAKNELSLDQNNIGYLAMNTSIQAHSTVHKATTPNQNESFFVTHDRGLDHPDVLQKIPLRG